MNEKKALFDFFDSAFDHQTNTAWTSRATDEDGTPVFKLLLEHHDNRWDFYVKILTPDDQQEGPGIPEALDASEHVNEHAADEWFDVNSMMHGMPEKMGIDGPEGFHYDGTDGRYEVYRAKYEKASRLL